MNPSLGNASPTLPEGYADWLAQFKGQIALRCPSSLLCQQATDRSPRLGHCQSQRLGWGLPDV